MRTLALSILVVGVALAACTRSEAPRPPPKSPATLPDVGSAPRPARSAPAAPVARVASVALGSALDPTKKVVSPKSTFTPTDTIYASVDTQGWSAPVTLTARWTYEDGQVVSESSQQAEAGPGTTEFHIAKPSGWPTGKYKVEISANGAVVSTKDFVVN